MARDVKQADGFIVVGYTGTRMPSETRQGGKVVKQQTVGDVSRYSVAVTKDSGFIAAGKDLRAYTLSRPTQTSRLIGETLRRVLL